MQPQPDQRNPPDPLHGQRTVLGFQRARRRRREKAAEALAEFSNDIGFVD